MVNPRWCIDRMLRLKFRNGTRTERAVHGREPGSIPVVMLKDLSSADPIFSEWTPTQIGAD